MTRAAIKAHPQHGRRPVFAFVRHPAAWLRSFWRYNVKEKKTNSLNSWYEIDPAFDFRKAWSRDFETFIKRYLDHYPGRVGEVFDLYAGPADDPIDFIGRQERLVDDLVEALTRFDVPFDETKLRAHKRANQSASPKLNQASKYPPDLRAEVMQAEADTLRRYGYGPTPHDLHPMASEVVI